MVTQPFTTKNPQEFKLRLVWSLDGVSKLVAEFSNSNWLPRVGETLILPTEEADKTNSCHRWGKFEVANVIYDFRDQVVRVLCSPISPVLASPAKPKVQVQQFQQVQQLLENRNTSQKMLAAFEAMEARMFSSGTQTAQEDLSSADISCSYNTGMEHVDMDDELAQLRKLLDDL